MGSKPSYPAITTLMSENMCEHSHLLGLYIVTILSLINNGHKPLTNSFRSFLQVSKAFIDKAKQESNNHILLDKIRKAIDASAHCKIFIKEQITVIKNSIPTSKLTYTNVASQGAT